MHRSSGVGRRSPVSQQFQHRHADLLCDALDGLQGEVAFATFDAAHVRPMEADDVGEGFLAQATLPPVGGQVAAERRLQLTFHLRPDAAVLLLGGLHTYE